MQINQHQPQFASHLILDVGQSNLTKGSLKLYLNNDKGEELDTFFGTVADEPFENEQSFENGLAQRMADIVTKNKQALLDTKDPIDGIVGFLPGHVAHSDSGDTMVATVGNLRRAQDLPDGSPHILKNINLSNTLAAFRKAVGAISGKLLADDIPITGANDMVGGAAFVAKALWKDRDQYGIKPNDAVTLIMTGGGLGVAEIQFNDETKFNPASIVINGSEHGQIMPTPEMNSIEQEGACVNALTTNFTQKLSEMGMALTDEQQEAIKGKGEVITVYDKAKEHLGIEKEPYLQAANAAIFAYIDNLARYSAVPALRHTQKFVLTGPVVNGIKQFLEEDSNLQGPLKEQMDALSAADDPKLTTLLNAQDSVLAKLMTYRMWDKYLSGHGRSTVAANHPISPFQIITTIVLENNAKGGSLIKQGLPVGLNGGFNRYIIPFNPNE